MRNKKFDCVKMKWDIQKQILQEYAGVPDAQARRMQMQQVMEDPILGPFCRKVRSARWTTPE